MAIPPGQQFDYGARTEAENIIGQTPGGPAPINAGNPPMSSPTGPAEEPFSNPVGELSQMASGGGQMIPPNAPFEGMTTDDFSHLSPIMRWVAIAEMSKSPRARQRARLWLQRKMYGSARK